MDGVEKEIRFHLEKMSGPLVKGDKYRAVIDSDKDEPVDAIEEICKSGKFDSAAPVDSAGRFVIYSFEQMEEIDRIELQFLAKLQARIKELGINQSELAVWGDLIDGLIYLSIKTRLTEWTSLYYNTHWK